jgi:hypothetical protein
MTKQTYLNWQKEKILNFSRELYKSWDITKENLEDVYYYNFIKN